MDLNSLSTYLLAKKGATEETPFGPEALVYKVMGKMFALIAWQKEPLTITLKCEPGQAMFLRDVYPTVRPGYHMNKTHWNTVTLDETIPESEMIDMIDDSYKLVANSLPRSLKDTLNQL